MLTRTAQNPRRNALGCAWPRPVRALERFQQTHQPSGFHTKPTRPCGCSQAAQHPVAPVPVAAAPSDKPSVTPQARGVLIIGGGPAGYCAAIALAKHGYTDIVVCERAPSASFFDPGKSYMFSVSVAGKDVLRDLGVTELQDVGLTKQVMEVTRLMPDGSISENQVIPTTDTDPLISTWLPRNSMNELLYSHIVNRFADKIQVQFGTKVEHITIPTEAAQRVIVTTSATQEGGGTATQHFTSRLLIGADGANSTVRQALASAQPNAGWAMERLTSPAAGLVIKVLPLPPCPKLSTAGSKLVNPRTIVCPGVSVNGAYALRLGMLPSKDLTKPRTANFILWPSHPFWSIKTTEEFYEYLEKSFPQLDLLRDAIPEDVARRFLESEPLAFKEPQSCSRLVAEFPEAMEAEVGQGDAAAGISGAAVLLLGDAAHVFPPDIGQGVNAAILDAGALAMCAATNPTNAQAAFQQYEAMRIPENKALVRMMQTAFPYQYRQDGTKVAQALWGLNAALRLGLSKILPQVFNGPVALSFANGSPENRGNWQSLYQDTERRGNETTLRLVVLSSLLVAFVAVILGRGLLA